MVEYLYARAAASNWFTNQSTGPSCHGVLLRRSRGVYVCKPEPINEQLLAAVQSLNVEVAFTMSTYTTEVVISSLDESQTSILLRDGSQVQILESMSQISSLSTASMKLHQYVALLKQERVLLIWHDDLDRVLPHALDVESKLLYHVSLVANTYHLTNTNQIDMGQRFGSLLGA
jgi:hypothetical protein